MEQKTEASQAVDERELVRACKAATSDAETIAAIDAYYAALKAQPAPTEAQGEPFDPKDETIKRLQGLIAAYEQIIAGHEARDKRAIKYANSAQISPVEAAQGHTQAVFNYPHLEALKEIQQLRDENAELRATQFELVSAAAAVVARWDSPKWKDEAPTADFIARLRQALELEPVPAQGEDSARLDWLEHNGATLSRMFDDSAYILSVGRRAVRTDKSARAAIDYAMSRARASAETGGVK